MRALERCTPCRGPVQALDGAAQAVSGGLHDVQRWRAGVDSSTARHAAGRRGHAEDLCRSCSALAQVSVDQCGSCSGPAQALQRTSAVMQRTIKALRWTLRGHSADQCTACSGPVEVVQQASGAAREAPHFPLSQCSPVKTI